MTSDRPRSIPRRDVIVFFLGPLAVIVAIRGLMVRNSWPRAR